MPGEDQTHAMLRRKQSQSSRLPGGWQAGLIAALAALLFGYWAKSGNTAPRPEGQANISRLAEIAPQDVPAALDSVSWTRQQVAQFRERDSCRRRLAWVSVVRAPGQAPGRIRLQSGSYISPVFDLMDTPVRVAIPYPSPYATGHGAISVVGTTIEAIVALNPPWRVPAQAGVHVREVSWTPVDGCPSASK